jgi:glycosyltransferase involved in cell wall biosynthesis
MVISQKVKVSVCISIYNGERFIRKCLDSVVCQTLKEIEIVLVNNGSTDLSLKIMNEYKEIYPNIIRVYSQEDKGLAQGRQTGIDNARGQFVAFLDADDFVSKDAYEKMYDSAIKHSVDIVECMTLKGNKVIQSKYKGLKKASEILQDYFLNGDISTMIWLRLYNRSLFINPVMPNMYVNNEDIFAFPCLLHVAKNIYYLKEQLHYYSIDNEQSVMKEVNNKTSNEEKIIQNRVKTLYVVKHLENFIGINYIDKKYSEEFNVYTARTVLNFCMNEFKSLSVDDSIKIATEKTGVYLNDLNYSFKRMKHFNKLIQKSINYLGFKKTVFLYRTTKGLFSSLKG